LDIHQALQAGIQANKGSEMPIEIAGGRLAFDMSSLVACQAFLLWIGRRALRSRP